VTQLDRIEALLERIVVALEGPPKPTLAEQYKASIKRLQRDQVIHRNVVVTSGGVSKTTTVRTAYEAPFIRPEG